MIGPVGLPVVAPVVVGADEPEGLVCEFELDEFVIPPFAVGFPAFAAIDGSNVDDGRLAIEKKCAGGCIPGIPGFAAPVTDVIAEDEGGG